ncbi:unnamed protein product [Cuscuta campestris]|uniref:Uncharacterized protein n=1 Tax=Cuscuta campestris TaxID=132261 RepID=A0A484N5X1_9ASTE|nr:unnamed protein product [Cuscuta campestris]
MGNIASAGAKVSEYKGILVFFVTSTVLVSAMINVAPRFADMFAYFWPLFISTTVFMGAIIAFTQVPPLAVDYYTDERDGEWLLEYLTGLPQQS